MLGPLGKIRSHTAVTGKDAKDVKEVKKTSKTEEEAVKKSFEMVVNLCPKVLSLMEVWCPSAESNRLAVQITQLSAETGTTMVFLRHMIKEEFALNAKTDPNAILRGNCLASKVIKEYIGKIGAEYLQTCLSPWISQLCELQKSLEVDPNRKDASDDIDLNQTRLMERVRNLFQIITSEEMTQKIPLEIKKIASIIGEFASHDAPDMYYPLVGGFLILRFISPALTNPEVYKLCPENKITPLIRRNLVLVTKVIQNLANGTEFSHQKESYMSFLNEFLRSNSWLMQKFLQNVITSASTSIRSRSSSVPNPFATADVEGKFSVIQDLFVKNRDAILENVDDEMTGSQLAEHLDKISSYYHMDEFLKKKVTSSDNASVKIIVEMNGEYFEDIMSGPAPVVRDMVESLRKNMKKKATTSKPAKEEPKQAETDSTVFGKSLDKVMLHQAKSNPNLRIPQFLQETLDFVLLKGVSMEGVFRLSGDVSHVRELKRIVDLGQPLNLLKSEYSIADASSLIKLFLKELPDSIIPDNMVDTLLKTEKVDDFKGILSKIPKNNLYLLESVVRLMNIISQNSSVNMMTVANCAIVSGPSFIKSIKFTDTSAVTQLNLLNKVFEVLIYHCDDIFRDLTVTAEEQKKEMLSFATKLVGHQKSINHLMLLNDTRFILSSDSQSIRFWDAEAQHQIQVTPFPEVLLSLCEVPSTKEIWISSNQSIKIMNYGTGKLMDTFIDEGAQCVYAHPASSVVLSASLTEDAIFVFDVRTKNKIKKIATKERIYHLKVFESTIWAGTITGSLYAWDSKSFEIMKEAPGVHKRKLNTILDIPQWDQVWTAGDDAHICIWDRKSPKSQEPIKKFDTFAGKLKYLEFYNDIVWCCTWDCSIRGYSQTLSMVTEVKRHTDVVSGVLFIKNENKGLTQCWSSSYDTTINVWNFNVPELKKASSAVKPPSVLPSTPTPVSPATSKSVIPQGKPQGSALYTKAQFFTPNLSREKAEQLLRSTKFPSFLVRNSSQPNSFALSRYLPAQDMCEHFLIETDKATGKFKFSVGIGDVMTYNSLEELVSNSPEIANFKPYGAVAIYNTSF